MSVINTNYLSMVAQSNLSKSQGSLGTAIERLSSGLRINSAKDDAAGQAIANRMTSQIKGLQQAQRNANDGISAAQTAEGALNQVNDNLQRIRELTVQAANGTNSAEDLTSIQNEIGQRLDEINRISEETTFNGTKVLAADNDLGIQVGAKDGEVIKIGLKKIDVSSLKLEGFNVNGAGETANTAATKDSLTVAGAKQVGTTNEYVIAEANGKVSASSLLSNAKNGDVISAATVPNTEVSYAAGNVADVLALANNNATIASAALTGGPANTGNYTFDSAKGVFNYSETIDVADAPDALEAALTPGLGKEITATVKLNGADPVEIVIDDQGNITNKQGQQLYLDGTTGGSENLTVTDNGGLAKATVTNLSALLGGNTVAANSAVTVGDVKYTNDGAGELTVTGQSLTTDEMAALIENDGATVSIASGAATISINGAAGTVTAAAAGGGFAAAGDKVYLTAANELSNLEEPTVSGFDSAYTFNAEKGAFTYSATTGYDNTAIAGSTAQETLKEAMAAEEGETTKATITLGGKSTDVVIGSNGSLKSAASGKELFLDTDGNLTETDAAGSPAATIDNVTESILDKDGASIAIQGGATYTVEVNGANSKLKADGLTASADVVADRLDNNAGGSFEYKIADFDGKGNSQTVTLNLGNDGQVAGASFSGGVNASGDAYVGKDGNLTANETEDTSYFLQSNGNVTNGSGERVYENGEGGLTTEAVTKGGRTENALGVLDDALATVDALRSDLGAIQNRFESAIDNLNTTATNLSAARSRIEDADYATEVSNMTRAQILQQAGTSVLAQANQIPQGVLSLLG